MARSNPFGNRSSAVGKAANAFAGQGQSVSRAAASARSFVSGSGRAPPSNPRNPRASPNQGTAQRPTGDSAPGRSSGTPELRVNSRRSEKINNQQKQDRARQLFDNARKGHADAQARVNAFSREDKDLLNLLPRNEFGMIDFGTDDTSGKSAFDFLRDQSGMSNTQINDLKQKAGIFNQQQLLGRGPAAPTTPGGERALAELRDLADGIGLETLSDEELLRFNGISGAQGVPGDPGFNPKDAFHNFNTGNKTTPGGRSILEGDYIKTKGDEAATKYLESTQGDPNTDFDPHLAQSIRSTAMQEAQAEQQALLTEENRKFNQQAQFDSNRPDASQIFDISGGTSQVSGTTIPGGSPEDIAQTTSQFFGGGGGGGGLPFGQDSLRNEDMMLQASLSDTFDDENLNIKVFQAGRSDAKDAYTERLNFEDELNDVSQKRIQENERKSMEANKFAREKLAISKSQQSMKIRRDNAESELRNRRTAAKLGINFDTGGIQWMQKEIGKGQELLHNLEMNYALGDSQLAAQRVSIINEYELKMTEHDLTARQAYSTAYSDYQGSIKSLQSEFYTSQKDVRTTRKEARERYADKVFEIDKATAEFYTTERHRAEDRDFELSKQEMDKLIDDGDVDDFISKINSQIEQKKVLSDSQEAIQFFGVIEEAYSRSLLLESRKGQIDPETCKEFNIDFVAVDNEMINAFVKMTDPGGLVRPSEFDKISGGASYVEQLRVAGKRILEGGVASQSIRKELRDASIGLKAAHMKVIQQNLEPFINRVDRFNRRDGNYEPVELTDIIPAHLIPNLPDATINMWGEQIGGGEAYMGGSGALPQFDTTAVGLRTDRHNNPTALAWSPRLETWFNDRGYNVTKGDVFPENPNAYTMDMSNVKDPYAATRDYIDDHSFYYKNEQRWSHTGITKDSWDSMSVRQKDGVIENMYRKEKGSGELSIAGLNGTPINDRVAQNGNGIIQKAYATDVTSEVPDNHASQDPINLVGEDARKYDLSGMWTGDDLKRLAAAPPDKRALVLDQITKVKLGQLEARGIEVPREPGIAARATAASIQGINDASLWVGRQVGEAGVDAIEDKAGKIQLMWDGTRFVFQKAGDFAGSVSTSLSQDGL